MLDRAQWQIQSVYELPDWFIAAVKRHSNGADGRYIAQLLWQRGMRDLTQLSGFLEPKYYQPTNPFEFGAEMHQAVERLKYARQHSEQVAIWGDFDADGITATAVLWEGLGQFFMPHHRLTYYIPNRIKESHGLSVAGLEKLSASGCSLIVTCDTGSTNLKEIDYAHQLGMDVIVTDHHTLPPERPPVTAIINPRYLPSEHPLATLSGVAVAYKLVEALYESLPTVPTAPLTNLLDLVAIGLIADLVELTGDCRYLAQCGIEQLQQNQTLHLAPRSGIAKLLELCKRNGDRPTDISFGLGPRINAISRIHGDAHFCVELLTSKDVERCRQLAEETELANARRKSLQKDVVQQVKARLAQLDLSTTSVIVLSDSQWSIGILGLVAGQIAQEYQRPTILLSTDFASADSSSTDADEQNSQNEQNRERGGLIARGSARSVQQIDLYQLVATQTHLLCGFGGHPMAMGLSLPVENTPLFTEAINREMREQQAVSQPSFDPVLQVDLVVSVAELGKELFRELKLLEPCGIGNPPPRLLIQNCWFTNVWNRNIQDWKGRKVRYIKTEFDLWDDSVDRGFPGVWWDHYKDEIPSGRCDAIVELDFNSYKKQYKIRLIGLRRAEQVGLEHLVSRNQTGDWILDWRGTQQPTMKQIPKQTTKPEMLSEPIMAITQCPSSWNDLYAWFRRAMQQGQSLALAYSPPTPESAGEIWQQLVGIAKYLSRTGKLVTRSQLQDKLGIGDRSLQAGFQTLKLLGFKVTSSDIGFHVSLQPTMQPTMQAAVSTTSDTALNDAITRFRAIVQEEQFRRHYFYEVPLATIQYMAYQFNIRHAFSNSASSPN